MYKIIGGDGRQYGPVTDAEMREWIAEGRLNAQSLAQTENETEFRPLSTFPEFADALGLASPEPVSPPPLHASSNFLDRDYELDIGGCISRGFQLLKDHFSEVFVGVLIYLVIEGAIGGMANIPIIGPVFSIVNFIISGPLLGGVFYLLLQSIRGEPVDAGAVFEGFRRQFGQLFLGTFIQALIIGVCLVPALISIGIKMVPMIQHGSQMSPEEVFAASKPAILASLPILFICLVPVLYLTICWKFTLPLIIDRNLDFWKAMKTSFRMVNRHWWHVFGLVILIELIKLAGLAACCVGLLFALPIGLGALMYAYETIFGGQKT